MRYILIAIALIFICSNNIQGQDEEILSADRLFNKGNKAYEDEQFDDAIFYYERAKLLDPLGEDIATNLNLANERLSTDIIELDPFFLIFWWNVFNGIMLPGGWKIFSVLCLAMLLLAVYLYFFKNKPRQRVFYMISGILFSLFILSLLAGNSRVNQIYNSSYVIVVGADQSLYIGPDEISEKVKDITGGNKLKILDAIEEWYKVSAMDSEQGWIKKENVRLLKFGLTDR
ncbi:MAG: hypothetical protein AAGA77_20125 [Bacteroidota bacterium]